MSGHREASRNAPGQVMATLLGHLGLALLLGFPTLLIIAGVGLLGHDVDWREWQTYAGILLLALTQLGVKVLLSRFRDGRLLESLFVFPKRP